MQAAFPEALAGVSLERFHRAVNVVRPSFIRVDADETTYGLHIILRFELEQALLFGGLGTVGSPGGVEHADARPARGRGSRRRAGVPPGRALGRRACSATSRRTSWATSSRPRSGSGCCVDVPDRVRPDRARRVRRDPHVACASGSTRSDASSPRPRRSRVSQVGRSTPSRTWRTSATRARHSSAS